LPAPVRHETLDWVGRLGTETVNETANGRAVAATFTGTRWQMLGLLLRGYVLTLFTIGIYRFWLTTQKRRFYWKNTEIDGEPLEYTGTALQLLVGFLFAVAIFLPLYILFFYLSTQAPEILLSGYAIVGVVLYFLSGYALYRARRFRLTRTLWRGIRFGQEGSAWGYALRRFLWTVALVLTGGLAYPWMASSLTRYRYVNTWFGDRQFGFAGGWKTVALPYFVTWLLLGIGAASTVGGVLAVIGVYFDVGMAVDPYAATIPSLIIAGVVAAYTLFAYVIFIFYRAAETNRIFSAITAGIARVRVKVRGWTLLGQTLVYAILASVVAGAFTGVIGVYLTLVIRDAPSRGTTATRAVDTMQSPLQLLQFGWVAVTVVILLYLGLLAAMGILAELILGLGYWKAVAKSAVVTDVDSLATARAKGDESTLAGEGLADALNVGAY